MPSSRRRSLRDVRRAYTGEDKKAAEAGVGRGGLGVTHCSPVQRRFRATLAVHLFNENNGKPPFSDAELHSARAFLSYTMTVSPRYDELLCIVPGALENALSRLSSSSSDPRHRVPGLRVAASAPYQAYHLVDLVTGGRMTLARQSAYPSIADIRSGKPGKSSSWAREWPGLDVAISPVERAVRARIPAMTEEIEALLAALVACLDARDPAGEWALGLWWTDPLRRSITAGHDGGISLWGSGGRWELAWTEHPDPDDIVGCLTDPHIGVPGAAAVRLSAHVREIRLGSSVLTLRYGVSRADG
ncbi:hypothetical protein [Amycolatopsis sp. NPDC051716]|uniref:hypothetical protein n=1 Tax=Amycolatopsis sp. NPDC051716 TaxID=3155804 RepID=UPI0034156D66